MDSDTLVIQSHRTPLPYAWIADCLESVRGWVRTKGYDYHFLGDEIFAPLASEILHKTKKQKVVASDLARLYAVRTALQEGYACVVWCDADFLIFSPGTFDLAPHDYAFGREVWLQHDAQGRIRVYKKIHNAFMYFRQGNSFLDFYIETAERLLHTNTGGMPAQFIGPKLLTALHNIVHLPVTENAGMLSPLLIQALLEGDAPILAQFQHHSPVQLAAANLCASSCERGELSSGQMSRLIELLLSTSLLMS